MFRFSTYVLFLLMVAGLSACLDHRTPVVTPGSNTTRLRVKALTLELPDNLAKVSSFRYDAQGRLGSILTYQTPDSTASEIEFSNYQYDGQNRMTGLRREAVLFPRGSRPNAVEQYSYAYDASGRVISIDNNPGFTLGLGYNGTGQLAGASRSFRTGGLSISGSDSFTFTGNNLSGYQSGFTVTAMGGPPFSGGGSSNRYTHDDKINPFYGVLIIPAPAPDGFINLAFSPRVAVTYFGGTDNVLNLSQNNVLTETPLRTSADLVTYQYQYNAANLPTVRVKRITSPAPNNSVRVEVLRFEYESY